MTSNKPDYADELEHWLRFDNWFPNQAFALFTEDDPEKQGTGLGGAQLDFDRVAAKKENRKLAQLWSSGNSPEHMEAFPPIHFIEWATQKRITIPWLKWAKENGLISTAPAVSTKESNVNRHPEQTALPRSPVSSATTSTDRTHVSDKLAKLNQAADKFWKNASRSDPETQPKNSVVSEWLQNQGLSATLADKGSSIIRPEWATTGRKPEK